tara:strand:- start:580 stop:810 length:231 start_codon:yes stop_codon:yes gene_type:complete
MIINSKDYLKYSIILFLLISIIIWNKKPKLIFDSNNNIKQFGTGKNKTIFYFPFLIVIIAIIIFFIFNMFHLVISK